MLIHRLDQMDREEAYFKSLEELAYTIHASYNYYTYSIGSRVSNADAHKLTETYIDSAILKEMTNENMYPTVTIQLEHSWFTVNQIYVIDENYQQWVIDNKIIVNE